MSDLIRRSKLLDSLPKNDTVLSLDVRKIVLDAPAVDAAPVVHGRWIGEADGYADGELVYDVWNCSRCDYCIDDGTDNPELLPNYCPNCGAKMDGEGDAK